MTLPEDASAPVPLSFLPPPKHKTTSYVDEPIFELGGLLSEGTGPTRAERLAELEAQARAENPDVGKPVPWHKSRKPGRRR